MSEVISLLKENNLLLHTILAILLKIDSLEYQANDELKQFCINVIADIFVEGLDSGIKKDIINKFKNYG